MLENIMRQRNALYEVFTTARERVEQLRSRGQPLPENLRVVILDGERQYSRPTSDGVAALLDDEGQDRPLARAITVFVRGSRPGPNLQHLSALHRDYDALHYVVFLPHGHGWGFTPNLPYVEQGGGRQSSRSREREIEEQADGGGRRQRRRAVTAREYYNYLCHFRDQTGDSVVRTPENTRDVIFYGRRLFEQWLCDQWTKVEDNKLHWVRTHQQQIRADLYQNLEDALDNDEDLAQSGRRVILPSSFTGSPRNLHQRFLDVMAMTHQFGPPHLFITMTANPNWDEVQEALKPGQSPRDRADIINRIFQMKKNRLMNLIKGGYFGGCKAQVSTVEFQKRCVCCCIYACFYIIYAIRM